MERATQVIIAIFGLLVILFEKKYKILSKLFFFLKKVIN